RTAEGRVGSGARGPAARGAVTREVAEAVVLQRSRGAARHRKYRARRRDGAGAAHAAATLLRGAMVAGDVRKRGAAIRPGRGLGTGRGAPGAGLHPGRGKSRAMPRV